MLILKYTADGSPTIFVPELNEHYHSVHGAVQESMHVFINNGFLAIPESVSPLRILEIGFGTGLNALLTLNEAEKQNREVIYHSVEAHPLPIEIWSSLKYDTGPDQEILSRMHLQSWEKEHQVTDHFVLKKINEDLRTFHPDENNYHLIYFDAFGPDVQPDLWTAQIFSVLITGMKDNGILVTYSVKGDVKRALRAAGYKVRRLPGPPGKREMLRAVKAG